MTWMNMLEGSWERPGDGENPGWVAGPGDVVAADVNPVPVAFEATTSPVTQPPPDVTTQTLEA